MPSTANSEAANADRLSAKPHETRGIAKDQAALQIGTFQPIDAHHKSDAFGVNASYRHPPGTTPAS